MMFRFASLPAWFAAAMVAAGLAGCASGPAPHAASPEAQSRSQSSSSPAAPGWEVLNFPGKARTQFVHVHKEGRDAVMAVARASVSMKRLRLDVPPDALGAVRFSWMVPQLIQQADMSRRDLDDSPARIVLVFDGDRSRFTPAESMMSELARTLTGEEMPYATLMYVWEAHQPLGAVVVHPRSDRIRKWVVDSGPEHLGTWRVHQRDLAADFERAFGERPGALVAIGKMTDADNTRARAEAWYGSIEVMPCTGGPATLGLSPLRVRPVCLMMHGWAESVRVRARQWCLAAPQPLRLSTSCSPSFFAG